ARDLLPAFDALDAHVSCAAEASARASQALPSLSRAFASRASEAQSREEAAERDERSAMEALNQLQSEREALMESQQALQHDVETARARWREAWSSLHPEGAPPSSQPTSADF